MEYPPGSERGVAEYLPHSSPVHGETSGRPGATPNADRTTETVPGQDGNLDPARAGRAAVVRVQAGDPGPELTQGLGYLAGLAERGTSAARLAAGIGQRASSPPRPASRLGNGPPGKARGPPRARTRRTQIA